MSTSTRPPGTPSPARDLRDRVGDRGLYDDDAGPELPERRATAAIEGKLTIPHLGSNRYARRSPLPTGRPGSRRPPSRATTTSTPGSWRARPASTPSSSSRVSRSRSRSSASSRRRTTPPLDGSPRAHQGRRGGDQHLHARPRAASFDFWGGNTGTKVEHAIDRAWLSLADLEDGDVAVWVGRGNADGTLRHLRRARRQLHAELVGRAAELQPQHDQRHRHQRRDRRHGQPPAERLVDRVRGLRLQRHQPQRRQGPGETGRPELHAHHAPARQLADGPRPDHGHAPTPTATTSSRAPTRSASGPSWRPTTTPSTRPGSPTRPTTSRRRPRSRAPASTSASCSIIGLGGRMDWGVHAYDPTGDQRHRPAQRRHRRHGQLRHDPQRARPAVPRRRGLAARRLRRARRAVRAGRLRHRRRPLPATRTSRYELAADGSYAKGKLLNTYVTEHWDRPTGCTARDVDGNPLVHGVDETVASPAGPGDRRRVHLELHAGRPVRPLPDRPGHTRRQLRCGGRRQLRLRRRLLRRRPLGADRPRRPGLRRRDFEPLLGGRTTWSTSAIPDDATGEPDVQGDRRRRHQHRQRRPDHPAGAAARVRRRAAHRRPRR